MSETKQNGISIDWDLANNDAAQWANSYVGQLVQGIEETTRQRIAREVQQFITNQETVGQLTSRLSGTFGEDRARMIAVTETTRAFAEGNLAAWRESGVVKGKRWRTNNDELVCPICGPLNGVVVLLDAEFEGGYESPPAHPRCRCWITPVVGEVEGLQREPGIGAPRMPVPSVTAFVPAQSLEEAAARFSALVDDYQLGDLPLEAQNAILRAGEDVLGSRGLRIRTLDFHTDLGTALGASWENSGKMTLDIDFLLNPQETSKRLRDVFEWNKQMNLENYRSQLASFGATSREGAIALRKIEQLELAQRNLVSLASGDLIENTARHEFYHFLDYGSAAAQRDRFSTQLVMGLHDKGIATSMHKTELFAISEYAASTPKELFAELAAARDIGIDLPRGFYEVLDEIIG